MPPPAFVAVRARPRDGLDDHWRPLGPGCVEDRNGLVEIGYVERADGVASPLSGGECRGERLERHG